MEIFQTFAEASIGILGFTAIVIMFKSQHSDWNRNVFNGMISHCIQAFLYSILPFILDAYHCSPQVIWTVCSIVLGVFTFLQGVGVWLVDKESKAGSKFLMIVLSTIIAMLQFFNVFGIWTNQEKGPYIIGITWHMLQALIIFTLILTKKTEEEK